MLLRRILSVFAAKKQCEVKLWMRLGATLEVSAEQAKKILGGDKKTLEAVLKSKRAWYFDGESYIPDEVAEEICEQLAINFDDNICGFLNFNYGEDGKYATQRLVRKALCRLHRPLRLG
jgi:hypothetical protein